MLNPPTAIDVLCIGHASFDLVFNVPHHPEADEKTVADNLLMCGGGPAANAAITAARLGLHAGFCGYLGKDVFGQKHNQELQNEAVNTVLVVYGDAATPLSTILVKPNGKRALINYKAQSGALPADSVDFGRIAPKVLLTDGHEPHLSLAAIQHYAALAIPTLLDAGSLHPGTQALLSKVDYLVASEKFACQYAGNVHTALRQLAELNPVVVITLGERGLIWKRGLESGSLPAPPIEAIDTTGAGDAFHGGFAAGLALSLSWQELLRYASAAGGYCCTKTGARPGLPTHEQVREILGRWQE